MRVVGVWLRYSVDQAQLNLQGEAKIRKRVVTRMSSRVNSSVLLRNDEPRFPASILAKDDSI